jgi:hypothetical protein
MCNWEGKPGASDHRRVKMVRQLMSKESLYADPSTRTSQMDMDALRHGLQRVAANGNINLCRYLLETGAEIDPRKDTEVAAVFRAAENGHVAIVNMLLQWKQAPVPSRQHFVSPLRTEARDRWGRTAIFPAAVHGFIDVLEALIAHGANINAIDKDNRTVLLHLAAERLFKWNEQTVNILLDKGIDVEAKDTAYRTPLVRKNFYIIKVRNWRSTQDIFNGLCLKRYLVSLQTIFLSNFCLYLSIPSLILQTLINPP